MLLGSGTGCSVNCGIRNCLDSKKCAFEEDRDDELMMMMNTRKVITFLSSPTKLVLIKEIHGNQYFDFVEETVWFLEKIIHIEAKKRITFCHYACILICKLFYFCTCSEPYSYFDLPFCPPGGKNDFLGLCQNFYFLGIEIIPMQFLTDIFYLYRSNTQQKEILSRTFRRILLCQHLVRIEVQDGNKKEAPL